MKIPTIRTRNPHRDVNQRRGFTLVELLVAITIIVALAALVVSMTRKIKVSAYRSNAMSSLRQVAAFNVAYSVENNGIINTMRYLDKYEGKPNWVKDTFWGRLQPYLFSDATTSDKTLKLQLDQRLDQLFNTPDADKMVNTAISGSKIYHDTNSGLPTPLAFNVNLVKWNELIRTSSFADPSQILYCTYGSYFFDETDGKSYVPRPLNGAPVTNNIYYLDDRKALAAFLDGHVEPIEAPMPERRFK